MREPEYTRKVEVDGVTYTLQKFTARKGLGMLTRLFKLIGEPMSAFAAAMDKDIGEVIPQAVKALVERMDETATITLIEDILKGVTIGGGSQQPTLDTHFQGELGHLFKLLMKALEFQYGDFLSALAAVNPEAFAGAKKLT